MLNQWFLFDAAKLPETKFKCTCGTVYNTHFLNLSPKAGDTFIRTVARKPCPNCGKSGNNPST